ncbi:MAG: hypothetical protein ACRDT4_10995, partial [Micromonosporaceae bacterium]
QPAYGGAPPAYPGRPAAPPAGSKRGWIIGGVAGVVVLGLVCALLAALISGGGDNAHFDDPAKRAARLAGEDLSAAAATLSQTPAVRYTGSFTEDGDEIPVTAQLTNDGWTIAQLTIDGTKVEVLSNGPRTYLRAPKDYWDDHGAPRDAIDDYAKQWVRVSPDELNIDLSRMLAPGALGADLAAAVQRGATSGGAVSKLDGTEVREVLTPYATVYVTTAKPQQIVRITQRKAASPSPSGRGGGELQPAYAPGYRAPEIPEEFEFDLTGLSEKEVAGLFDALERRVKALANSVDSAVTFSLSGGITLKPCNVNTCTATVTIANRVSSESPYLAVQQPVQATITIRITLDGRTVKVCNANKSMKPNGSAKVSCTATYNVPADGRTHPLVATAKGVARATVSADIKRLFEDLKAERKRGKPQPPGKDADLGTKWKPCDPRELPDDKGGCEKAADEIEKLIGGDQHTIKPPKGARALGKYRGYDTPWTEHVVVVKDGRVYDAWTGRHGEPIEVYKSRWEYGDVLNFGF